MQVISLERVEKTGVTDRLQRQQQAQIQNNNSHSRIKLFKDYILDIPQGFLLVGSIKLVLHEAAVLCRVTVFSLNLWFTLCCMKKTKPPGGTQSRT